MKLNVLKVDHGDLEKTFAGIRRSRERCGVPERGAKLDRISARVWRRSGSGPRTCRGGRWCSSSVARRAVWKI